MKKSLCTGLLLIVPGCPLSHAGGASVVVWSGSGELGFSSSTGNTHAQNLDARLGLNEQSMQWRNSLFVGAMWTKNQVRVVDAAGHVHHRYKNTANRYFGGFSVGYKLDSRSYIVGATRYDHDDFGANLWQGVVSVGYGYIGLKTQRTELSFEIGPGFKEYKPADTTIEINGQTVPYRQARKKEGVVRGLVNSTYRINANTSFMNTFLMETGSKDSYFQNDASLSVSVTRKLLLKISYEVRYHSVVLPGAKKTDTLTTTNIVYRL